MCIFSSCSERFIDIQVLQVMREGKYVPILQGASWLGRANCCAAVVQGARVSPEINSGWTHLGFCKQPSFRVVQLDGLGRCWISLVVVDVNKHKFPPLTGEDVTLRCSKVRWNFSFVLMDFYRSPGNSRRLSCTLWRWDYYSSVIRAAQGLTWKRY